MTDINDIYDLANGIGNVIKEVLPGDITIGVDVVPKDLDHQAMLGNYIDLYVHGIETTYTSKNNVSLLYNIGVAILINSPIDSKKTAQQRAMMIAEMIQLYLGYHDNSVYQYCLENGFHWVDAGKVEADRDSDMFKGSAYFDLTIRQDVALKGNYTITKFIKELYDEEFGLGGYIELS